MSKILKNCFGNFRKIEIAIPFVDFQKLQLQSDEKAVSQHKKPTISCSSSFKMFGLKGGNQKMNGVTLIDGTRQYYGKILCAAYCNSITTQCILCRRVLFLESTKVIKSTFPVKSFIRS